MNIILKYLLLQCLNLIQYAHTTMPIYCSQPLNISDCNETPRKVFSYYKPGSRCELEVWRGCPTANRFDTEEECSETCIFRNIDTEKIPDKLNEKCISTEDFKDCDEKLHKVYKYSQVLKDCIEVESNCLSPNLFQEKLECIQTCIRELTWDEKMKLLSIKQLKELDSILDSFANLTMDDDETENDKNTTSSHHNTIGNSTAPATTVDDGKTTNGLKKLNVDDNTTNNEENSTNTAENVNEGTGEGTASGGTTGEENNMKSNADSQATTETDEATTMKRGTVPMVEIKRRSLLRKLN